MNGALFRVFVILAIGNKQITPAVGLGFSVATLIMAVGVSQSDWLCNQPSTGIFFAFYHQVLLINDKDTSAWNYS